MTEPHAPKSPQAQPELGDIPDRLKDLERRLAAEQGEQAESRKPSAAYAGASQYSKGYRLATEFVAGVLVGGLLGYGVDYLFGTLPLFLIIFLLFGFGAGLLNMSRAANRSQPTPEELARMPKPSALDDEED